MRYVFGDCTLDTEQYVLYRAAHARPLQPKVFQVLHYLLTHRDRVVAKGELQTQVWPQQFISEATLEGVIKAVRHVVGDDGRMQWCIQTRRGQGYRFVAPVTLVPGAETGDQSPLPAEPSLRAEQPSRPPVEAGARPIPDLPASSSSAVPGLPEAEHRQLTVLVCHWANVEAPTVPWDPEGLLAVVRDAHARCTEIIQRFDGHIAQSLDDGVLVYFGYPQAHEDDAHRAIRTGLGMVHALGLRQQQLAEAQGSRLAVRVGIHTGLVVVSRLGGSGRQDPVALGPTPHIAAAIQRLAPADTVVISAATWQLVAGYFRCHALGPQALPEMATTLPVHQVLAESGIHSRLDVVPPRGLTPLVGRDAEITLLRDRWAHVTEGQGQVVVLRGEAGIGKSRLVQALKAHVAGEPHTLWECRCSPYYQNTALYPLMTLFQRTLHWQPDDTPAEQLRKLEQALGQYRLPVADTVPLLAPFLALPLPDARYAPLTLAPQRQKQKTLDTLLAILLEHAERQGMLFIVEDLHWGDPTTLEFLTRLLDQVPTTRLLTLLVCRPEFQPSWPWRAHLTALSLGRLSSPQAEQLLTWVAGGKALPPAMVQDIVTKTDGVPLFVEELTKTVLESGLLREHEGHYTLPAGVPPFAIPATLHDALMARLDRLGAVKAVAQLGATIGRTFAYDLLQAVAPLDATTLEYSLQRLVEAELVHQRGGGAEATYRFKHALIQEAAYHSLLRSTRQQYHQRIAHVLAAHFPQRAETQPEVLAHHYTEAGLSEPAIGYWHRAAERAHTRSAQVEASRYLRRALELLMTLPETPMRAQHELRLQLALGTTLTMIQGWAAPEVEHTYARARELCQLMGDQLQLFSVLFGLVTFYGVRAQLEVAHEFGTQCLHLAQHQDDATLLLIAHQMLGFISFCRGVLIPAQRQMEQAIALYDPQQHASLGFMYGFDPSAACCAWVAAVLWMRGYPDQALERRRQAIRLAQALSHPFSQAYSLGWAAILHQLRREITATWECAEAAVALSTEYGFPFCLAIGTLWRGWALTKQGRGEEGIPQLCHGLAVYQATGAEQGRSWYLGLLAEAYGHAGQPEAGLAMLAEALALVEAHGERFYEPELYRLQGELLQQAGSGGQQEPEKQSSPEACLQQALAIARRQEAKSLELRAATSLARLWQQQGKQAAAHALLAPVYGWFTEGFETADLQDAKALLGELGG